MRVNKQKTTLISIQLLPDAEHASLIKYLLKSLATDAANDLHLFIAAEDNLPLPEPDAVLTLEQRAHISKQCSMIIFFI